MEEIAPAIDSFVIRFIREPDESDPNATRGVVTHVQTSQHLHFLEWEDAVQFIRQFVQIYPPESDRGPERSRQ